MLGSTEFALQVIRMNAAKYVNSKLSYSNYKANAYLSHQSHESKIGVISVWLVAKLSQSHPSCPIAIHSCPRFFPESSQKHKHIRPICLGVVSESSQSHVRVASELSHSCLRVISESTQSHPRAVPQPSKSCHWVICLRLILKLPQFAKLS